MERPKPKLDIEGIKAKLVQGENKPINKVDNLPSAEVSSNVKAMKESLVQQFFGPKTKSSSTVVPQSSDSPSASVTKMKDIFELAQTSEPNTPSVKAIEVKSLQVRTNQKILMVEDSLKLH